MKMAFSSWMIILRKVLPPEKDGLLQYCRAELTVISEENLIFLL